MSRLAFAILLLVIAAPASGQEATDRRWYVSGAGTLSIMRDSPGTVANVPAPGNPGATLILTNRIKNGWGAQIAAGHELGRFRLEAEVGYTRNDSERYDVTSPFVTSVPQDGTNKALRLMANAYVDLLEGPVQPYVGAGAGMARIKVVTVAATVLNPIPIRLINDRDDVFAYQLVGGVGATLTRKVKLFAQYRWFDTAKVIGKDRRGERFSREISGHNIDIGIRVGF